MNTAQGQRRQSKSPQAVPADPGFASGNDLDEPPGIFQVLAGNGDDCGQSPGEGGIVVPGAQGGQVETGSDKDVPRQPARTAPPVLPDVLEDIGHLQALSEGDRQGEQLVATVVHFGRVVAEQLREHLTDHPGDVVAIPVDLGHIVQAPGGGVELLKLRHAPRHDAHAALDGAALEGTKSIGDAEHPRRVGDEVVLAGGGRRGERRTELLREIRRVVPTRHHVDEAAPEALLLRGGQGRFVLDRVGDSAKQVRVAHDIA